MSKMKLVIIIGAMFLFLKSTFAQNHSNLEKESVKDSVLLVDYLEELSAKHNYFFTYSPNSLANKKIASSLYDVNVLFESVKKLEQNTGFDFEYLGNRYYVIYPRKNKSQLSKKSNSSTSQVILDTLNQRTISGKIIDDSGQPLMGATILVKNTNNGTTSNFAGNYVIETTIGSTLVISYIGFTTKEVQVSNAIVNVSLDSGLILSEAVIVGSRNPNRTAVDTAIPVDIIDVDDIAKFGPQVSVTQILNYAAPSFSSNSQVISDGTDHIDPAQLRGLGPDQVLVLINGKRRHTSSLVNVNGTPGRGSVGTDLNTIPTAAIKRIEVLRDGASAQYGSDAIAGVINIVLKDAINEFKVSFYGGANFSKNSNDHYGGIDGGKFQVDLNYGLPLGNKGGYINLTGSLTTRENTSRARDRTNTIFHAYNAIEWEAQRDGYSLTDLKTNVTQIKNYAPQVPYFSSVLQQNIANAETKAELQNLLNFDVTNDELARRSLNRRDFNMKVGQASIEQGQFISNLEFPIGNDGVKIYGFLSTSYRQGKGSGFYRTPGHPSGRGNTLAYINGFLPNIESDIIDNSFGFGIQGKINGWDADVSHTFGSNIFKYNVTNSTNFYLQSGSPTQFYAGLNGFKQNTVNLDMSRYYDTLLSGFNVAFGAEYRIDNYFIEAGDEASYAKYDVNGEIESFASANNEALQVVDFFGNQPAAGSQVFSGFTPDNAVNSKRNSFAFYSDLEMDITKSLLVSTALRFENFSDFGNSLNYKIASRVKAGKNLNFRGAISTGFRAPSLHQQYYNKSNTLFNDDGVAYEVGTFTNTSQIAKLFGIPELKEETSFNASFGFTSRFPELNLGITIDGYQININDRISYTGDFTSFSTPVNEAQVEINTVFSDLNIGRAAFFANAINTKTTGLDIVITQDNTLGARGKLSNSFAATFSKTTKSGNTKSSSLLESAGLTDTYFDEESRIFLERALPRIKMNLTQAITFNKINFFVRNAYFGSVEDTGILRNADGSSIKTSNGYPAHPILSAKIITDLSASYKFSTSIRGTIGANNIFDIYPDELPAYLTANNQFVYSRRTSQFGYNGRFIFARISFEIK